MGTQYGRRSVVVYRALTLPVVVHSRCRPSSAYNIFQTRFVDPTTRWCEFGHGPLSLCLPGSWRITLWTNTTGSLTMLTPFFSTDSTKTIWKPTGILLVRHTGQHRLKGMRTNIVLEHELLVTFHVIWGLPIQDPLWEHIIVYLYRWTIMKKGGFFVWLTKKCCIPLTLRFKKKKTTNLFYSHAVW